MKGPQRGLDRRAFLAVAGGSLAACAGPGERAPGTAAFELDEVTLADLSKGMADGRWTAQDLVRLYSERIRGIDHAGPALRSVLELNPEAEAIAAALDRERREKGPRGPLHGIPVLLKDNLDTGDKMLTTAGSLALADSPAATDSFVTARLREAGAVILGKTNLSEWANFRSYNSSSGWSGRGGQTRNPYALDRNPCGSSSGSGVAVSANLCAVAVGTETNGSVVCPSSVNGIVGIKPTVGLVSRSGIIPISHTQDTAGPMARTLRDAAILLGALVGTDPADGVTSSASRFAGHDFTQYLDPAGLKGARIGAARNYFNGPYRAKPLAEEALEAMRKAGAEVIDVEIPHKGELGKLPLEVLLYEFKHGLNRYLAQRSPAPAVRTLEELIAFNRKNREKEMPYFQQEILEDAQERGGLDSPEYRKAVRQTGLLSGPEGIDAVMARHKLDALVAPATGPAWLTDLVHGDRNAGGSSSPAAQAGYPNIVIPMGLVEGLPVGMSFFGRAFSEPVLLRVAYAFEQETKARQKPALAPSVLSV